MPHGLKAKRQRHGRRNDTNATTPLSVPKAHPQVYLKPVYAKGRYTVPIFLWNLDIFFLRSDHYQS